MKNFYELHSQPYFVILFTGRKEAKVVRAYSNTGRSIKILYSRVVILVGISVQYSRVVILAPTFHRRRRPFLWHWRGRISWPEQKQDQEKQLRKNTHQFHDTMIKPGWFAT